MEHWFYKLYVYLLILIKIYFIVSLIILKFQDKPNETLVVTNTISKNIVMGLLAILMLYLFHPRSPSTVYIYGETKVLMFLFGILSLLELPWTYSFNAFKGLGVSEKTFSAIMTISITIIITCLVTFIK